MVNNVVGSVNLDTFFAGPREAIVAGLDGNAMMELGAVLRDAARVVEELCQPEQTYVCLWSHGAEARKHLHFAVQPSAPAPPYRRQSSRIVASPGILWDGT